ncbi:MAG: flagellar protein FlgN [Bacteroidetes bacterium]|nr:flagellar protein FlgN [Rhodothermia bacterium]MCX7907761.1 flagellar protein FlgN [Bacteroidota bacterium]MDW8286259.1 flagellar export chaperone FlgN [Bacteroidota bacterium]
MCVDAASWSALFAHLEEERSRLRELEEALMQQLEALRRADLKALDACVEAESAVVFGLHRLERQQRKLLGRIATALGVQTEDVSLSWLAAHAPAEYREPLLERLLAREALLERVLQRQACVQAVLEYAQRLFEELRRTAVCLATASPIAYDRSGLKGATLTWIDQTA